MRALRIPTLLILAGALAAGAQIAADSTPISDQDKPSSSGSPADLAAQFANRRADNSSLLEPDYPDRDPRASVDPAPRRDVFADFAPPQAPAASVSVQELRNPLSRKAASLLTKAQAYFRKGDRAKAMETIARALKEPSAIPYVHGLLGVEYLKARQLPAAVSELREATAGQPDSAENHSNFGFALWLSGHRDEAEAELREALKIDAANPKSKFLLGAILLEGGSADREALQSLNQSKDAVPSAHRFLAVYYARHGAVGAAMGEWQAYEAAVSGTAQPRTSKTR